jgi:hypothetical protein
MNWDNWPAGCEWTFAELDEATRAKFLASVVPVLTFPPGGPVEILGTAFVVSTFNGGAILITAAHVIDDVRRALGLPNTKARTYAPGFAPRVEMDRALTDAANRGELRVHVVVNGKADLAMVKNAALTRPVDAATLVVASELFTERAPAIALNSDILAPGTRVIAFGMQRTRIEQRQLGDGNVGTYFTPWLEGRAGRIREVHLRDPAMPLTSPAYELTLSIPHGMSGGPVLLAPEEGGEWQQVIAFASHDNVDEHLVNDCFTPGHGMAIPVMATYLLGPGTTKPPLLLDLVRDRHINDLGRNWPLLEIVNDGDRLQYKQS